MTECVLLNTRVVEMRAVRATEILDYEPTVTELASVRVPVLVIASADNRHANAPGYWRYQAAAHLASQLGAPLVELPGTHTSYLAQPRVFAEALRPHLAILI